MTPERWKQIRTILEPALDLPQPERKAFVASSAGADDELRAEVEALLAEEETGGMLEADAADVVLGTPAGRIGDRIGPYEIVSELGTGGMGAVYLARRADGDFEQRVAIKLIKRGMDSDAILNRFVVERRILASLDHPNIARLIDGGTTPDGTPFFVMEYVDGDSITEYADRSGLDLDARLELFKQVCRAVGFAHQNLVVHRDLKPSNILITKDGQAKLLDFGIAKLLRSDAEAQTATQNYVFTPEYASPEQVRGEQLTTATDIYSLGIILYELLTGSRPYITTGRNISEIIRAVCETQPARPSTIGANGSAERSEHHAGIENRKRLKGDLDNITLKAIRKEPERRYSSVDQLAADIARHQDGLPVSATADTWSYRASKFVSRNRLAVAAAALVVVTLIAGLFATLYQRNRANQRFNDVRQLANSFLFEFHDAIKDLPGSTPARELVVKRALEYLDKLAAESESDVTLQRELGAAYAKIGEIQGNSYHPNLGDTEGAMASYRRAFDIRQKLAGAAPNDLTLQSDLADSYEGIGDMQYTANELRQGLESYERAVEIRERLVAAEPENLEYRYTLANVLGKRGDISGMEGFPNLGDTALALESYKKVVSTYEELVRLVPDNVKYRTGYATNLHYYGMMQSVTGDTKGAIENGRKAVAIFESLIASEPNNSKYETHLMSALVFMRYPLADDLQLAEAAASAERVVQTMEKQLAADPQNAFTKRSLGVSFNSLGRIQTEMGEYEKAIANHERSLKIVRELLGPDEVNAEHKRDLALTLEFIGNAQSRSGDCTAAVENYNRALKIYQENFPTSDDLSMLRANTAKCSAARGQIDEALATYAEILPKVEAAAAASPLNVKKQRGLAVFYLEGGKLMTRSQARSGEARTWIQKSSEILGRLRSQGKLPRMDEKYAEEAAAELKKLS